MRYKGFIFLSRLFGRDDVNVDAGGELEAGPDALTRFNFEYEALLLVHDGVLEEEVEAQVLLIKEGAGSFEDGGDRAALNAC